MFIKNSEGIWEDGQSSLQSYLEQYNLDINNILNQLEVSGNFISKTDLGIILKIEKKDGGIIITPYEADNDSDLKFVYVDGKLEALSEGAKIFINNDTGFLELELLKEKGFDYYVDFKPNITIVGLMNVLDTSEFSSYDDLVEDLNNLHEDLNYVTLIKSYDEITTKKLKKNLKEIQIKEPNSKIYQTGVDEFTVISTFVPNSIITHQMVVSYNYFDLGNKSPEKILEQRKEASEMLFDDSDREEDNIIRGYFRALYHKTDETVEHSDRLQKIVTIIGEELMLDALEMKTLRKMCTVHDIGKLAVEGKIINKAGKLDLEEFELIKKHTILGHEMLKGLNSYSKASISPLQHHEFWNGKGYPNQLKGEEINFLVRIISVADTIDTMASKRVYKEAYGFEYIKEELDRCQGNQFCPVTTKAAVNVIDKIEELYK